MKRSKQKDRVFVAIHTHKNGTEVDVFRTLEAANKWRDLLAANYWNYQFEHIPMPKQDVGEIYFDFLESCGVSWFEIEEQEIKA